MNMLYDMLIDWSCPLSGYDGTNVLQIWFHGEESDGNGYIRDLHFQMCDFEILLFFINIHGNIHTCVCSGTATGR